MISSKIAASGSLVTLILCMLSGCDQLNELKDIKTQAAVSQQQISELKSQLSALNARISALETAPPKAVLNDPPQPTAIQDAAIKQAIAQCVQFVRGEASTKGELDAKFYAGFDAFYNEATGRVQNNVVLNGGMAPLFEFNKCMSSRGIPLS